MKKYLLPLTLLFLMACEHRESIVDGLSQNDANEIIVLLKDHNISAQKVRVPDRKQSSFQVTVKNKHLDQALRILVNNQLPKSYRAGFKEVYPPGSSGFIPTKSDENARFIMASQGEIESLIRILPGVVDTRVMLSLGADQFPKSASVSIVNKTQSGATPPSIDDIKNLVASSLGSISLENIHVVEKEISVKSPEAGVEKNSRKNSSLIIWGLIFLTILALLIAGYLFFRPYLKLKFSSNVKELS
ncbi:MAG: hypothetical protein KC505_00775 [Myxococcales bacterium]|nr:hypothetical protein [Myxococcales bacterium]USN51353.1 MAG: hypothetical protein H6731_02800 [Myxococcales bacterium]